MIVVLCILFCLIGIIDKMKVKDRKRSLARFNDIIPCQQQNTADAFRACGIHYAISVLSTLPPRMWKWR